MLTELRSALHRYDSFLRETLRPAEYGASAPLAVSAFQCAEPVALAEATRAAHRPVAVGFRWGPAWSTCWFHVTGTVPDAMAGRTVALRFSSGTEALAWADGAPLRGFDRNRDRLVLVDRAAGGERVDLRIEAACNHPFGITAFAWDPPETQRRWESGEPGLLERCELTVHDSAVRRLCATWAFACDLLRELPEDGARAREISAGLRAALRATDVRDPGATAPAALATLEAALRRGGAAADRCVAVGHAHIDTAWLWPLRETRRKCLRTFSNVLELMDRDPSFRFVCSQPQQYAWVEEDAPALFARIRERVREGRWEPAGAMWIEPDCNVPSGESLVRQILHGVRWWQDRFGADAPQRILYLPDTFGFPAALPQIMAGAGIDTFITNKLSWNERNTYPHTTFRWRGLDGSEVLAHLTPGHDYNAQVSPVELRRGAENAAKGDDGRTGVWLQPYGFGDGGGGPTEEMLDRVRIAGACEGVPAVVPGRTHDFREELLAARAGLVARGDDLPVWDGELYLELHRGTYTTQSWLKRANRRAERDLFVAEWLRAAGPEGPADGETDLDEAWELLLLNQFHDILPGSSIARVYDDARPQMERVSALAAGAAGRAAPAWAAALGAGSARDPIVVLNPLGHERSEVIDVDGAPAWAAAVPGLGAAVVDRAAPADVAPVRADGRTLANGHLEAEIDDQGRVVRLVHRATGRDACARGPLGGLGLYEDRPRSWEAWDIDPEYIETPVAHGGPSETPRPVETHPLRAALEVAGPLGAESRITLRYELAAGSPRLDVRATIDWRERRRLLRVWFPTDVRARFATYETQFGHIVRAAHANTPWEQAMFEVCAHTWADCAEPGFGLALLNDGRYGHSCTDGTLGLTLLRGPMHPDPGADLGVHEITWSLMPHAGDWREAGVDRWAHALNAPLRAITAAPGADGPTAWAPFTLSTEGAAHPVVSAVKPAADGGALIVRLVETHGGRGTVHVDWALPVAGVEPVDLLERPVADDTVTHDATAGRTTIALAPFRIVTLAVRRSGSRS